MGYGAGYGFNRPHGAGPGMDESLTSQMEQSTQRTFQTLEQIVQVPLLLHQDLSLKAFGGFAQMLESTFFATHSSFMAMVGVAEQFGNLRGYLGSIFSITSLITTLRDLVYRIQGREPPVDPRAISADGFSKFSQAHPDPPVKPKYSSRPFWVFLTLVVGLPWLMSKLIKRMNEKRLQDAGRDFPQAGPPTGPGVHPSQLDFAKALYEFSPESPAELALTKGQIVAVLERLDGGWWKGRTQSGEIGYFPANRVEVLDKSKNASVAPTLPGALPSQAAVSPTEPKAA